MMNFDKIRTILNIVFIFVALIAIVVYFMTDDNMVFIYACGFAICIKLMEFIVRFIPRR